MKKAIFLTIFLVILNLYAKGEKKDENMKIYVKANNNTIVFVLNNSTASKELYSQLPLSIKVENYSTNEKIFYPSRKLSTINTPMSSAKNGSLAYYAPWGNVVMFYKDFKSSSGLYELGSVESGIEHIANMSGIIEITKE